jgi:hypothetical protein
MDGSGVTGGDELARVVGFLRRLPGLIRGKGAEAAAAAVGRTAARQYAAGAGPLGAWPPNKDGTVPLRELTEEITFRGQGGAIHAEGPDELRYHMARRPAFPPQGELPPSWARAADEALAQVVERERPKE